MKQKLLVAFFAFLAVVFLVQATLACDEAWEWYYYAPAICTSACPNSGIPDVAHQKGTGNAMCYCIWGEDGTFDSCVNYTDSTCPPCKNYGMHRSDGICANAILNPPPLWTQQCKLK